MRKSIVWIPVLFVGSMLYWTLALGMGGLSLVSVAADSLPCGEVLIQPASPGGEESGIGQSPADTAKDFQSITVNLGESFDGAGQSAGAVTVDLLTDRPGSVGVRGDGENGTVHDDEAGADPDRRDSGRRARSDQGPGETAF